VSKAQLGEIKGEKNRKEKGENEEIVLLLCLPFNLSDRKGPKSFSGDAGH